MATMVAGRHFSLCRRSHAMALNHFDRRTFLRVGALGVWGNLHLADALAMQALEKKAEDLSVIMLWCAGGMSQFETWTRSRMPTKSTAACSNRSRRASTAFRSLSTCRCARNRRTVT
jgi:hypothetical protein